MPDDLPRPVQVLHEGRWYHGELEGLRRRDDGWWGAVRYTTEPGSTYLQTRHQSELRPADTPGAEPTPWRHGPGPLNP